MGDSPREQRIMGLPEGYIPEIDRWIWALEDARGRTREVLEGLPPSALDWTGPRSANSIGSILYHIAAIEADYLYADLLQVEFPQDVVALFPYEVREENGRLTPVQGFELDWYISRLDWVRARLLEVFGAMTLEDFRRARQLSYADITPEWTLYHLAQHEAEHRGEIRALRAQHQDMTNV
jgi:uncharacterized damage-inducible protein DinB